MAFMHSLYAMTLSIPNFILELLCPLLLSKLLSCPTASERSVLLSKKLETTVSDLWRSLWEWDDRSDAFWVFIHNQQYIELTIYMFVR